jgi:mevalonate kinase
MAVGHGKVILLGEHAVVYGVPAIGAAIPRGVVARARASSGPTTIEAAAWDMVARAGDDSDVGRALCALLAATRLPADGVTVDAEPSLPGGAGLGGSAALGVAVARALAEHVGTPLEGAALREAALAWERVFHGNPSGIDTELAIDGGIGVFTKGEGLRPIRLRAPLDVVIGDTGERASTRAMVAAFAREKERSPEKVGRVLEGIASLVRNAALALEAGDLCEVGKLMDLDQTLLASMMMSTARIEEMCGAAREAGAWGCKLTGAGGGGAVVAIAPDPDAVLAAWTRMSRSGFRARLG